MTKNFDVIIVGAGPAGLECARQFEDSSLSVLLIEKNKDIGLKVCAGGLTCLSSDFNIPKEITRTFKRQSIFISGKKEEIELKFPLKTVDRLELGSYLFSRISSLKNVFILKAAAVKEIKQGKVITDKGDFGYKYLVGADGSLSAVRKFLKLKTKLSIGLRYKIPCIVNNFEWHFYPKILKTGYLWIFPHKSHTNIGIFFEAKDIEIGEAKKFLENFLKEKKYNFSGCKPEAAVLNFSYQGCVFGNVFLAGEAAGLTSRTTGEGIAPALISGREVGMKILDPEYKMPFLKKILKIKKRQEFFKKLSDLAPFMNECFLKVFAKLMKIKRFQIYFEGAPDFFKTKNYFSFFLRLPYTLNVLISILGWAFLCVMFGFFLILSHANFEETGTRGLFILCALPFGLLL